MWLGGPCLKCSLSLPTALLYKNNPNKQRRLSWKAGNYFQSSHCLFLKFFSACLFKCLCLKAFLPDFIDGNHESCYFFQNADFSTPSMIFHQIKVKKIKIKNHFLYVLLVVCLRAPSCETTHLVVFLN